MELDINELDRSHRYKLLVGAITPRPIAVVSTRSTDGRHNLAPFSWFNGAGADPMAVMFCVSTNGDGSDKDTLRNALPVAEGGTGEFVINVATEMYARQVIAAAETLPFGESEFDLTGLTPAPSKRVAAPRVAESPVSFECRTLQVVRLNPGVPVSGNIVIGEVIYAWIDDRIIDERLRIAAEAYPTIGRMGGNTYCRTRDLFEVERGAPAMDFPLPFEPAELGVEK